MSKHSPGPWRWSSGYTNGNGEPTWSLIAANGYGILSCDIPNAPQSCNAHDADVLEAAPDLLEALKDALMVMTSQKVRIEEQADAITKARAAIAKAEIGKGGD